MTGRCSSLRFYLRTSGFLLVFWLIVAPAISQKQLVLLKHEKIINRYKPGSVITYKLKNRSEYLTALILDIRDFSIITSFDTVPFSRIDRVSLKGVPAKGVNQLFGSFLMLGGIGYFAVDQVNSILVHGQGYDNDPAVWQPALIMVGSGFLLKQIRRRSMPLRYPIKLFTTEPGHVFYKPED